MSFYNLIIAVGIKTAQVVCDTITNVGGITVTAVYCRLLRVYSRIKEYVIFINK